MGLRGNGGHRLWPAQLRARAAAAAAAAGRQALERVLRLGFDLQLGDRQDALHALHDVLGR